MKIRTRTYDLSYLDDLIETVSQYLDINVTVDDTDDGVKLSEQDQLTARLLAIDDLITALIESYDAAEAAVNVLREQTEELNDKLAKIEMRLADMALARMDGDMAHAHKVAKIRLLPYVGGASYHNVPVNELEEAISAAIEAWVAAKIGH
jgi:chromosome segregation ATPase